MNGNNRIVNINIFEHVQDEEDEEMFGRIRRPYILKVRKDHLDDWDNLDFRCRFRLKKEIVMLMKPAIERRL